MATMRKIKVITMSIISISTLLIITLVSYMFNLNSKITEGLENKKFLPPTEYYSASESFTAGMTIPFKDIVLIFKSRNYRERAFDQRLFPGDYAFAGVEMCKNSVPLALPEDTAQCLLFVAKENEDPDLQQVPLQLMTFTADGFINGTFQGNPLQSTVQTSLEPELVAQFLDNQPIMQDYKALGEIPPICLNAVLAIEDSKFLEHSGISLTGIGRAAYSNLFGGKVRQGGSTITQQTVKNYFLTSERTLKRKAIEFFMSLLLEAHASKDRIFETYLNIIYLGQNGPFQVRGFGAASQYYFQKPVEQLELSECSLLAAVLNSPGVYDPFKKPENATKRRNLVLSRMTELGFISAEDAKVAGEAALPTPRKISVAETAPYYINAVNKQLSGEGFDILGMKVYTGLNLRAQSAAQIAVRGHLDRLEKENKKIKAIKEKGASLEGMLLSSNVSSGLVTAVVGGRGYRLTQFNRAIDGHRQIGSIMKPFVFLTALINGGPNGKTYEPNSLVSDTKFNFKYEGQSWSPDNYGKKYFGEVPMYFALKNSLNAATASLGIEVGLDKIIDTAELLGVTSKLNKVPSLTLGAFELYPSEVLESYMTLARMGNRIPLSFVRTLVNNDGKVLYRFEPPQEQAVEPAATAELVGMMKQTVLTGTARYVDLVGFKHPAAGKTGTTSDNKDAWFAGFTPNIATVVWVGYDNNTPHGLTGSSGAVPIWTEFMKNFAARYPTNDFAWPDSVEYRTVAGTSAKPENAETPEATNEPAEVELIFKK